MPLFDLGLIFRVIIHGHVHIEGLLLTEFIQHAVVLHRIEKGVANESFIIIVGNCFKISVGVAIPHGHDLDASFIRFLSIPIPIPIPIIGCGGRGHGTANLCILCSSFKNQLHHVIHVFFVCISIQTWG